MRPTRLELHGFTAFREPVCVDFEGADLFAFTGPTGSGKSSLIDGMCFALYGSVPRLDRRTVAPVISTGRSEARVRLDFTVGRRPFTAVRVVRRTAAGGATTKEARLESGGQVLAGDADALTAEVGSVLGLGFEQFTKCVVLPQGEFARFLHDTPKGRQELLVRLLELEVYARMRGEANIRATAAMTRRELTERQLEGLAGATPSALGDAEARVERLLALRNELDGAQPRLEELGTARQRAERQAVEAGERERLLAGLVAPEGVAALDAESAATRTAAVQADAVATAVERRVADAERARSALPGEAVLAQARELHRQRATLTRRLAKGRPVVAEARAAEQEGARRCGQLAAAVGSAEQRLAAARREHAAHAVAATLVAGEPCPVCEQPVSVVPVRDAPAALSQAEAALAAARAEQRAADEALVGLREARAKAERTLESLGEDLAELEVRLAGAPDMAEVDRLSAAAATADAALAAAREAERTAREAVRSASDALEALRRRRDDSWTAFEAARDRVAALGPPPAARDDLAGSWERLAAWAASEAGRQGQVAAAAAAAVAAATREHEALTAQLAARCDECGVVVGAGVRSRDAVVEALATATGQRNQLAADVDTVQRLRGELAGHAEHAVVARTLGRHLAANRFEQWLLDEALHRLAAGASEVLRELSAGQYSLGIDAQRNFSVVDHRNADEPRPARTLSGGETFLASLALALTLAEHFVEVAVGAEPRLESIFLDEGFGTLDPETLDVVAAAIEELGARGRTIGIVTHVRDLAERVPVRYEVRKGPAGSTVDRIER